MKKLWTENELSILKQMYADHFSQEIADKLGRKVYTIYNKAHELGFKKSDRFMKMALEREGIKLNQFGQHTRFTKGHVPQNKGKKMAEQIYDKIKPTFFKKGHDPHNTKHDGYERICAKDGYIYMRISKAKFVLKHRYIYEQHHGKIPHGMVVIFKDGNKLNTDINNLEAITKQQHIERNRIHNYPKEIKDLIKLKNKLKKQINEKQN